MRNASQKKMSRSYQEFVKINKKKMGGEKMLSTSTNCQGLLEKPPRSTEADCAAVKVEKFSGIELGVPWEYQFNFSTVFSSLLFLTTERERNS
ncbi:hypothetical protein CEXT_662841 [Caerostris extrusa]|uniref:Uncharacterized protein n=1 Tax=Caerostris extrusa TaxID=172846 RepID=A0AAV4PWQ6_CAEEX|nr:hypothetical protein CEXT_662841 [Caerostris extrusa]